MRLGDLKIGIRLYILIAFISILIIFIGAIGISGINAVNKSLKTVCEEDRVVCLEQLKSISDAYAVNIVDTTHKVRNGSLTWEEGRKNIEAAQKIISENWNNYILTNLNPEEKRMADETGPLMKKADSSIAGLKNIMQKEDMGRLNNYVVKELYPNIDPITEQIAKLVDLQVKATKAEYDKGVATYKNIRAISVASIFVCLVLAFVFSLLIIRSITKPVSKLNEAAGKIAQGDLNVDLQTNTKDEIGTLSKSFKVMIQKIAALVADANMLADAAIQGKLDTRADAEKHGGEYRNVIEGFNKTLDAVIEPLNVAAEYVDRIAKGERVQKITSTYLGDFNKIKDNLNTCIDTVSILIDEVGLVINAGREGKLGQRANPDRTTGVWRKILRGVNDAMDNIIKPLNVAAEYVDRIAKGDIPPKITENYNGDFNEIKNNLNNCIDNINNLIKDANLLAEDAMQGKLDTRADASKHQGDYNKIIKGVNKTLDAVIGPLNVAAEYVDRIAKGDIPPKITENYNGDFNEIKNNLNNCIDNINNLIKDANLLAEDAMQGKLDTRADASKHQGDYNKIIKGVNKTLDAVIGPLNVAAEYVDRIAKGDIPPKITENYNGDFNEIKNNLNTCIDTVKGILEEANILINAVREGNLEMRGNTAAYSGGWGELVEDMNSLIKAVAEPVSELMTILGYMGVNDYSYTIDKEYMGIWNDLKNSSNKVISILKHAVEVLVNISNGNISDLDWLKKGIKRSENDQLRPAFIKALEAIQAMLADADTLAEAAEKGKLDIRADASKHNGEFRKIIEGVNKTLDVIIEPLNVSAEYMDRISKGDIPPRITDTYYGDFNEIKNNLNMLIDNLNNFTAEMNTMYEEQKAGDIEVFIPAEKFAGAYRQMAAGVNEAVKLHVDNILKILNILGAYAEGDFSLVLEKLPGKQAAANEMMDLLRNNLQDLITEMVNLTKASVEGRLQTRGNADKFKGGFKEIINGVNDTLNAVIGPLNVSAEYMDRISKGDIPPRITDTYYGDFNEIKNNLNMLIDNLNNFTAEMNTMYEAQKAGDIEVFIPAEKFAGAYRQMAAGVNEAVKLHVDNILKILNILGAYAEGDFSLVLEKLPGKQVIANEKMDLLRNNLQNLITEMVNLAKAAVEGRLQTRGNADKFKGGFKEIINGVNDTLDAVIKPVNEAAGCLKEMAEGNLEVKMTGKYQGDHAIIKEALNTTLEALNNIIKKEAVNCLQEIAEGNLDVAVTGEYRGDYAVIKNALNKTINDLNEILGQIIIAIDQVSNGAVQVSDSSQSLSQGAAESASTMEEITSSMQEMNTQTKRNAENAAQANQLAAQARNNAEKGNEQMAQMVKAMGDINESASNISKIIKAIDEIAFQTNLLALNAAVEAARAGKHGKGFTVVAEEVRNLAQRSAKAAKETAEMIEDSIKKTEAGARIAEDTSSALKEIVLDVTKVTDFISEIASASKEQAQGIEQINEGLSQVDQVTQQNSASSEELAAASEEMSGQSEMVKQMLGRFKLKRQAMGSFSMASEIASQAWQKKRISPGQARPFKGRIPKAGVIAAAEVAAASFEKGSSADSIISLDDQDYRKF